MLCNANRISIESTKCVHLSLLFNVVETKYGIKFFIATFSQR